MCIALCTIVEHNTAQNRPDNFPSYPPDNHRCSDDVYLRDGGKVLLCHVSTLTATWHWSKSVSKWRATTTMDTSRSKLTTSGADPAIKERGPDDEYRAWAYNRGLGWNSQESPWSGAKPPEAESFLAFERQMDVAKLPSSYFPTLVLHRYLWTVRLA